MSISIEGAVPQREYDLFVIYDEVDRPNVEVLVSALEKRGIKVWFDRRSLIPGVPWQAQLEAAIKATKFVLVFLGSKGFNPWEQAAYTVVLTHVSEHPAVRVIPALGPGATPDKIPLFLQRFQYIDLRDALPDKIDEIVARIILPKLSSKPDQPLSPRIFLCHAKEDAARVEELYFALGKAGLDPWYDKRELIVGVRWEEEIKEAIQNSEFFAICLSQIAVSKRGFIQREIRTAVGEYQLRPEGISFVLPIRLEPCRVPRIKLDDTTYLSSLQWIDVFENDKAAVQLLVEAIWKHWKERHASF
jgi:hypothetical protein